MKQDTPHMERLRELARTPTKWFDNGAPLKMSMLNEDLRDDGLISMECDGFIYLTAAGLRMLRGRPAHAVRPGAEAMTDAQKDVLNELIAKLYSGGGDTRSPQELADEIAKHLMEFLKAKT